MQADGRVVVGDVVLAEAREVHRGAQALEGFQQIEHVHIAKIEILGAPLARLALLGLQQRVAFTRAIRPVCLPVKGDPFTAKYLKLCLHDGTLSLFLRELKDLNP